MKRIIGLIVGMLMAYGAMDLQAEEKWKFRLGPSALLARTAFHDEAKGAPTVVQPGVANDFVDGWIGDGGLDDWGYVNGSQRGFPVDTIHFHDFARGSRAFEDSSIGYGVEAQFSRQIFKTDNFEASFLFGAHYYHLNEEMSESRQEDVDLHTYVLWTETAFIPDPTWVKGQRAPVNLKPGMAMHTVATDRTTFARTRELNAHVLLARIGPQISYHLKRLTISADGGFVGGLVRSKFHFDDSVNIAGVRVHESGFDRGLNKVIGWYAGGNLDFDLGRDWSLFLGAHYFALDEVERGSKGRSGRIDLSKAATLTCGIGFEF